MPFASPSCSRPPWRSTANVHSIRRHELIGQAAGRSVQLILFPEAFVSGYPRGLDFGTRVGSRTPEGREMFRRYWESAVDVPGPATEAIGGNRSSGECPRRDRRDRARRWDALLLGPLFRSRRNLDGEASQADADRRRAARMGFLAMVPPCPSSRHQLADSVR